MLKPAVDAADRCYEDADDSDDNLTGDVRHVKDVDDLEDVPDPADDCRCPEGQKSPADAQTKDDGTEIATTAPRNESHVCSQSIDGRFIISQV